MIFTWSSKQISFQYHFLGKDSIHPFQFQTCACAGNQEKHTVKYLHSYFDEPDSPTNRNESRHSIASIAMKMEMNLTFHLMSKTGMYKSRSNLLGKAILNRQVAINHFQENGNYIDMFLYFQNWIQGPCNQVPWCVNLSIWYSIFVLLLLVFFWQMVTKQSKH